MSLKRQTALMTIKTQMLYMLLNEMILFYHLICHCVLSIQVARFRLSGNFSLLILLPLGHAADALETMEKRLSQEIVNLLINQLEEAPIRAASVSLPQINIDTNVGLNDALSSLGE